MKYDFEVNAKLAKACPFCGSKKIKCTSNDYYYNNLFENGSAWITCENCGVELWNRTAERAPYNEAIKAAVMRWNRRCA